MAITTLDGALAGMQFPQFFHKAITPTLVLGRQHSTWYLAGDPGPGTADTSTAGGVARSSTSALVNGQIPHYDPAGGVNSYLARFAGALGQNASGKLLLCDRLLDCGAQSNGSAISPTSTSAQTINTTTLPARDRAGSTNGDGVIWGLEVSTAQGAGTPTATIGYTNQAGTTSRSATNDFAWVASSAIGAFYTLGLQAGDTGIRSIQTLTMSSSQSSGQLVLVAYRVLAEVDCLAAASGRPVDLISGGFPQLFNGTVPFIMLIPGATTATNVFGQMIESQG